MLFFATFINKLTIDDDNYGYDDDDDDDFCEKGIRIGCNFDQIYVMFAFQVTADLNGGCTARHTGTSVAAPFVAGFVALALEAK